VGEQAATRVSEVRKKRCLEHTVNTPKRTKHYKEIVGFPDKSGTPINAYRVDTKHPHEKIAGRLWRGTFFTSRFAENLPICLFLTDSFSPRTVIHVVKNNQRFGQAIDVRKAFDEHHALLFRFSYRLTGSVADAEDLAQTCFVELLRPDCTYDPGRAPLRTWLFGVVHNQFLKRLRQKPALHTSPPNDAPSPEHGILQTEMGDVVRRAVMMLPEMQREVLILSHYEQMQLAEIAGILDIEVGAVKSRLQRARASLRETLAAYAPNVERER
jgi:RNA polymerase sigma-70 factor (ECF subfamily)